MSWAVERTQTMAISFVLQESSPTIYLPEVARNLG